MIFSSPEARLLYCIQNLSTPLHSKADAFGCSKTLDYQLALGSILRLSVGQSPCTHLHYLYALG